MHVKSVSAPVGIRTEHFATSMVVHSSPLTACGTAWVSSSTTPFGIRLKFLTLSSCLLSALGRTEGIAVSIPRKQIKELAHSDAADLARVEIQPGGDGISFRKIDVDIYVPGLLADELGTMFAKALGHKTRGRTTLKKAAASRSNGRKGGRPRKSGIESAPRFLERVERARQSIRQGRGTKLEDLK